MGTIEEKSRQESSGFGKDQYVTQIIRLCVGRSVKLILSQILHWHQHKMDSRLNSHLSYGLQRPVHKCFWFGGINRNLYFGYQKAGSLRYQFGSSVSLLLHWVCVIRSFFGLVLETVVVHVVLVVDDLVSTSKPLMGSNCTDEQDRLVHSFGVQHANMHSQP